jgi:hypothetical protein
MTTQRKQLQTPPAQVERMGKGVEIDLHVEELEERIAPLWNRKVI